MKYCIPMLLVLLLLLLPVQVNALEIAAPEISGEAATQMPEDGESFGDSLIQILQNAVSGLYPNLKECLLVAQSILSVVLMLSLLQNISSSLKIPAELAGTAAIAGTLLYNTNAMFHLGAETILELSEYGKLLCPVMTTALAAQGSITASAALYAGTMAFITLLANAISSLLLPGVYLFLALSVTNAITGEQILKSAKGAIKTCISWFLKLILTIFTTYLSITGVISGTTDAAALKATKVTISSFVPVVGSILSDASEAVLVSAGVAKNAAGIYGIYGILAVFLRPFLKIGVYYLIIKVTTGLCEVVAPKNLTDLTEDFSTAMGLILGMTGSVCLLLLVSTVCYMKGTA